MHLFDEWEGLYLGQDRVKSSSSHTFVGPIGAVGALLWSSAHVAIGPSRSLKLRCCHYLLASCIVPSIVA